MSEPKNPRDMTPAEIDALPRYPPVNMMTPRRVKVRGVRSDDVLYVRDTDGIAYSPVFFNGAWYKW